jgi:hypothetical protein
MKPNGMRLWRFKYVYSGVEKLLALGAYPEVPLKRARAKRDEARRLLADAVDPSAKRKSEKSAQAETFAAVAVEWLDTKKETLTESTWARDRDQLVKLVGPYLGTRPIAQIEAPELLAVLKRLEKRGVRDTAHRVRAVCGRVFRYAIATGRAKRDPSADLKGALAPKGSRNYAAITEPANRNKPLSSYNLYGFGCALEARISSSVKLMKTGVPVFLNLGYPTRYPSLEPPLRWTARDA